jgi:hypothetical protein
MLFMVGTNLHDALLSLRLARRRGLDPKQVDSRTSIDGGKIGHGGLVGFEAFDIEVLFGVQIT